MPAKKKRKPKYTSGVLAKDGRSLCGTYYIVFFRGVSLNAIKLGGGLWGRKNGSPMANSTCWQPRGWTNTYKLTPPRPGQAFECDVEL